MICNIDYLDGWLPRTKAHNGPIQTDDFSENYICHGLNVLALCDPGLIFMYVVVTAPGKVNYLQAFNCCRDCLGRLDLLPNDFYVFINSAYILSRWVLILFTKSEMMVAGLDYDLENELTFVPFSTANAHQICIPSFDNKVETASETVKLQKQEERQTFEGVHQTSQLLHSHSATGWRR